MKQKRGRNTTRPVDNFANDELFELTSPVRELGTVSRKDVLEWTSPVKVSSGLIPKWRRLQDGLPQWRRLVIHVSTEECSSPGLFLLEHRGTNWQFCLRWIFLQRKHATKWNIAIMSAKIKWGIEACCFLAICVVQGEKEAGEEIHDWIVVSKRFGLSLPCLLKLKADPIRVGSTNKMIKTKSHI